MPPQRHFVLLITGAAVAGKTTIARMLRKKNGLTVIHGDAVKRQLFGLSQIIDIDKSGRALASVHKEIIKRARRDTQRGRSVAIEYWAKQELLDRLKKHFGSSLVIRVLFPAKEVIFNRNKAGPDYVDPKSVSETYALLQNIKHRIGIRNYIDTSRQKTPGAIFNRHFRQFRKAGLNG